MAQNFQACTTADSAVCSTKENPILPSTQIFPTATSSLPLVTSSESYSSSTVVALAEGQERAQKGRAVAPVMATSVWVSSPNPTLPAAVQFSLMSPNQSVCQC